MNPKLLLFLVFLCFPTQSFYRASGIKIRGSIRDFGKAASNVLEICDFYKTISEGKYNCSSLLTSAVTYAVNTDQSQTMPDVSIGKFILELYVGGGTKVQTVALILDITLDYTFTLCRPCSDSCSTRNLTVYNPSLSSTFSNYTCRSSECPSLKDYVSCSSGFCMYNYITQTSM
jgi:Xylanase inhibitor N-terminal